MPRGKHLQVVITDENGLIQEHFRVWPEEPDQNMIAVGQHIASTIMDRFNTSDWDDETNPIEGE